MRPATTGAALLLAWLAATAPALAQKTESAPAQAAQVEPPKTERPVRVRASHRVDVIAPGERVETVIDRLRASSPATPPADARPGDRPPPRPPEGQRAPDRGGAEQQRPRGERGGPPGEQGPRPGHR